MSNENPPVSFYFNLSFSGISGSVEASFEEVSGIAMEMGTEEITEGESNRFKHKIPTAVKFPNLILKRGLVLKNSALINWCVDTLGGGLATTIETKTIMVSFLDASGLPLKSWSFVNACPIKWSTSDLHSMTNEVLIETLEFAYSYYEEVTLLNPI